MAKLLKESKNRLVSRANILRIASAPVAQNMRNGNFKSLFRGQGIEFSDVRDYNPGDNVRAIDWNVTARMGRPFIKQYEEDRDLQVFFIMDRSFSMYSGSRDSSKIEASTEAAALLVLASDINASSMGAVFFDGEIRFSCSPKSGRDQAMFLLSHLDTLEDEIIPGSALSNALNGAGKLLKKRSLVFIFSDFRSEGWVASLANLALKNDVVAVRVTDPTDSELPHVGTIDFADSETGIHRYLPTSSASFSRAWFEANRRRTDLWKNTCLKHGAFPLELSTSEDPLHVLVRFFNKRGRR